MENKQGKPEQGSGKKSNAKELEDLHKKAIEKEDDGFEDFKQRLTDQIEIFQNKLKGGNEDIRRPKLPLKSFLRFHMEEFNLIKAKKPELTPNQIAKTLKLQWDGMSDAKKQRYIDAYEHDFSKYQRLLSDFEKLTQKPKKPITPFFQFFSDNLQVYKKNYPQLSQSEVTSIIGKDWSNFDASKKKQMQTEYERQHSLYVKAIKNKGNQSNSYVDYSDYMQKVEDYEKELDEELEALRSKHPKVLSNSKKDPKQKTESSKQDQPEKKKKKEEKQTKKVVDGASSTSQSSKPQEVAKQSQIPDLNKKQKEINIEDDLKDARSSNRQSSRHQQVQKKITRPAPKLKAEPELKKKVKVEKTQPSTTTAKPKSKITEEPKKAIKRSERVEVKAKTRSQSKKDKKPLVSSTANQRSLSSKKEIKLRTSSRLKEGKSKTKAIQKLAKVPTKKVNQKDAIKNVKILKRKVTQEKKIIKKSKKEVSESGQSEMPDDIEEVDLNANKRRGSSSSKSSNKYIKYDSKSGAIKHMLGMRNGEETQYLVHFQDGTQRWTKEDDPIFNEKRNKLQLGIFLQQIKENDN